MRYVAFVLLAACSNSTSQPAAQPDGALPGADASSFRADAARSADGRTPGDAAPATIDAAPGTADAAPGAPDAAPGAPDAAPGAPDAAPGAADASVSAADAAPSTAPDARRSTPDATPQPDALRPKPDASIGAFSISLESSSGTVVAGGSALDITVDVDRTAPFTGAVAIALGGFPSGVSGTVTIPSGATSGTLALTASASAAQGPADGTVVGTATIGTASAPFDLTVRGSPGTVDTSFATTSAVVTLAVQSDDQIVFGTATPTLSRLAADDTGLDPTFGESGVADGYAVSRLLVQANDEILDFYFDGDYLYHLTKNGFDDDAFGYSEGDAGFILLDTGPYVGMAVQSTGAIIVLSGYFNNTAYFLQRFNTDGSPDSTFGTNGTVTITTADTFAASALLVQGDDDLVVAGAGDGTEVELYRHASDGTVDTSFGTNGRLDLGSANQVNHVFVANAPGGAIAVAADVDTATAEQTFLSRVTAAGALDATFTSGNHSLATQFECITTGLVVDAAGDYVVSAYFEYSGYLARFDPTGALDAAFAGGVVTTGFPLAALVLDRDDEAVVGGGDVIARFWN